MNGPSLYWIDWSLHGRTMWKETAGRFLFCFLAVSYLVAMLLSGGVDRFLSVQYTITAILRVGVPDEEGRGIAGKVAALPPVREATYRDPEDAWREFLAAYPGLESLRSKGRNPLPGYVEVQLRPARMTEEGIAEARSALEPLPQVEKVLTGGDIMPRLFRMKRWANGLLWCGFALACLVFLIVLAMQEKVRAERIRPDVSFLADRGVAPQRIAVRRSAGAFVAGGILALLAAAVSCAAFSFASGSVSLLRVVVGSARELLDGRVVLPTGFFLLSAAALQGLASYAGWRQALHGKR